MKLKELIKGDVNAASVYKPKENHTYTTVKGISVNEDIKIEKGDIVFIKEKKWKEKKSEPKKVKKKRSK